MASATSRYQTILKLAAGGMATVWVGTVRGALGFRQLVAIKKPHPHLLDDPSFRSELVAEARLASMIHHANVVDVRDVEIEGGEINLVMDYIEGASLGDLLVAASRRGVALAPRVCVRIALDALAGLHAAHELVDERDRPVGLVHRDVSPQNILVGTDGTSRVADFGVAKFARKNMQSTSDGSLKGKLAYMAPEYLRAQPIDRRFDVFAMGVVLWEALTGKRCFRGEGEADTMRRVLEQAPEPMSALVPAAAALDDVLATALAKACDQRFQNAAAMAAALEATASAAGLLGGHGEVAKALEELVGAAIQERRALVRAKLANEPSVASLMYVPPITGDPPPTEAAVPATMVAETPKMGGAAAEVPPTVTSEALALTVGVPTTQPMTPRIGMDLGLPAQLGSTLASGPPMPAQSGGTLASAPPMPMPVLGVGAPPQTMRSDGELAFQEASGRSFTGSVVPQPAASGAPRWVLPAIVGVVSAAITAAAIVVVTTRSPAEQRPAATAPGASEAPQPPLAASAATTPMASASAPPEPSAAPSPSTKPAVRTGAPRVTPAPSASTKSPPPNPYAN